MSYYYDVHGLAYEVWSVTKPIESYTLVPHDPELDRAVIERARKLITIYEGPRNKVGERTGRSYPLSKNWFRSYRGPASKLMETTRSWFGHVCGVRADKALWTTFKKIKEGPRGLSPKGMKSAWLPLNTRATNEFHGPCGCCLPRQHLLPGSGLPLL